MIPKNRIGSLSEAVSRNANQRIRTPPKKGTVKRSIVHPMHSIGWWKSYAHDSRALDVIQERSKHLWPPDIDDCKILCKKIEYKSN
jgi:hypothetical protein